MNNDLKCTCDTHETFRAKVLQETSYMLEALNNDKTIKEIEEIKKKIDLIFEEKCGDCGKCEKLLNICKKK